MLSVNIFQMINTMFILAVGTNRKAIGNIYFNAQNHTNPHGVILANNSGIFSGRYTMPREYTGYHDALVSVIDKIITVN